MKYSSAFRAIAIAISISLLPLSGASSAPTLTNRLDLSALSSCLISKSSIWRNFGAPYPCVPVAQTQLLNIPKNLRGPAFNRVLVNGKVLATTKDPSAVEVSLKSGLNEITFGYATVTSEFVPSGVTYNVIGTDAPVKSNDKKSYILDLFDFKDAAEIMKSLDVANDEFRVTGMASDNAPSILVADLDDRQLARARSDARVRAITEEGIVQTSAIQSGAPWGLDRIDQYTSALDRKYEYQYSGAGVNIYVVDTGINSSHSEFSGRILSGTWARGLSSAQDCNGHGTHVSATAAGSTYGVAKSAKIIPVRIFGCTGGASKSVVISAINWIIDNHDANQPAVANFSLSMSKDLELNSYIQKLIDDGVVTVVAAGNDYGDACTESPASASNAITVGASTIAGEDADFSNIGSCVDIFAPGVDILSASIGSASATKVLSGTSMATPHVTGAAALVLEKRFASLSNKLTANSIVASDLIDNAVENSLVKSSTGSSWWSNTVNKLLYTPFLWLNRQNPLTLTGSATANAGTTVGLNLSGGSGYGAVTLFVASGGCSIAGMTISSTVPATCNVIAYKAPANGFTWAKSAPLSVKFTKLAQTINFSAASSLAISASPYALTATASSGLPVTFSSSTPIVCSISNSNLILRTGGTCSVTASQVGDATYDAATPITLNITVNKLAQTITFNPPTSLEIPRSAFALFASATSSLPVKFTSNSTGVCTVNGNSLTLIAAGTCSISVSQSGNQIFLAATTVTKTISIVGAPAPTPTATSTPAPSPTATSTPTPTPTPTPTATSTPTPTPTKSSQVITFSMPVSRPLNQSPLTLNATSSSGLPVSLSSSTTSVCTISGMTLTLRKVGSCSVTATQIGNENFLAAPTVTRILSVTASTTFPFFPRG